MSDILEQFGTPDAILVDGHYPKGMSHNERPFAFNKEFGPILKCHPVWYQDVEGHRILKNHRFDCPKYYPKTHEKAGQERFDWHDRGDGVQYGYLKEKDSA